MGRMIFFMRLKFSGYAKIKTQCAGAGRAHKCCHEILVARAGSYVLELDCIVPFRAAKNIACLYHGQPMVCLWFSVCARGVQIKPIAYACIAIVTAFAIVPVSIGIDLRKEIKMAFPFVYHQVGHRRYAYARYPSIRLSQAFCYPCAYMQYAKPSRRKMQSGEAGEVILIAMCGANRQQGSGYAQPGKKRSSVRRRLQ
jgi:hypothetical protein